MADPQTTGILTDLLDPTLEELRAHLRAEVHPMLEEVLVAPSVHGDDPRSRFEAQGRYVFGIFAVPVLDGTADCVFVQEVGLVATLDRVVVVRKTPAGHHPFDTADLHATLARHADMPAGRVVFELVDDIAERFLDLSDGMQDEIDQLEDHVESWTSEEVRTRISDLRHDLLHVRSRLAPTRDAVRAVVDDRIEVDDGTLFPREVELHIAGSFDKLLRASESLELARDLLGGVRDYYQAKIANDQNEVMKRLTAVASLLLLPTLIAAIYGQNFVHMPELGWRWGYAFSWALIVVTTTLQLMWFRRRDWL